MKYCKTQKKQSGLTLVESLLVLAVAALVAVLAYGGYKMANSGVKSQSNVESSVRLLTAIKKTFGSSGNYKDITHAKVNTSGIVPSDFDTATSGKIKAPWGGEVEVSSADPYTNAVVKFTAVPSEICMDLAGGIEGMVEKLVIGAATPKDMTANTPKKYTPSDAAGVCNATVAFEATLK